MDGGGNSTNPSTNPWSSQLAADGALELHNVQLAVMTIYGAYFWDLLISATTEYRLIFCDKISVAKVIYIISRLTTLSFLLPSLVFIIGPVYGSCAQLAKASSWCFAFALPANSLIFFLRIHAVFHQTPIIVILFGFFWFCTLAGIAVPFSIVGSQIGTTKNCVVTTAGSYSSAGVIATAIYDTLVFLAITSTLLMDRLSAEERCADRIRTIFGGRGMGTVSRSLLKTGQLYFLVTVGMNLATVAVVLAPSTPPIYRAFISIPNVALSNSMACRAFRKLKLAMLKEYPITWSSSQMARAMHVSRTSIQVSLPPSETGRISSPRETQGASNTFGIARHDGVTNGVAMWFTMRPQAIWKLGGSVA